MSPPPPNYNNWPPILWRLFYSRHFPEQQLPYCFRPLLLRTVFVRFSLGGGGSEFRLAMTDGATIAGMEVAKLVSGV